MINFSLKDKNAIVTGGRSGIGRAIAICFAEAGANVAVTDIITEDGQLEEVAQEINKLGRRSLSVQADVSKKSDVDKLVDQVSGQFGHIDILANCAGIFCTSAVIDTPEDEWDRVFDIDAKSIYLCSQAVAKVMVQRNTGGSIINIASGLGMRGSKKRGVYCAAKAAVINYTMTMAIELADNDIRVNAIAPGLIKTPISFGVWQDPEVLKEQLIPVPLGRIGQPEEIAAVALFFASDASSYVTGDTLLVDGGRHAYG